MKRRLPNHVKMAALELIERLVEKYGSQRAFIRAVPGNASDKARWFRGDAFPPREAWGRLVHAGVCSMEELGRWAAPVERWAGQQREKAIAARKAPRLVSCPCCGHVFDSKAKDRKWKAEVISLADYAGRHRDGKVVAIADHAAAREAF